MSKPGDNAAAEKYAKRLADLRRYMPRDIAGRLGWIAGLLHPTHTVACGECGQPKKVPATPLITKGDAIELLDLPELR